MLPCTCPCPCQMAPSQSIPPVGFEIYKIIPINLSHIFQTPATSSSEFIVSVSSLTPPLLQTLFFFFILFFFLIQFLIDILHFEVETIEIPLKDPKTKLQEFVMKSESVSKSDSGIPEPISSEPTQENVIHVDSKNVKTLVIHIEE